MKILTDYARCVRCNRYLDAEDLSLTRFGVLCEDCREVVLPEFDLDEEELVAEEEN